MKIVVIGRPALPGPRSDVARLVVKVAVGASPGGRGQSGGPDWCRMDEFFRDALAAWNDPRQVVTEAQARYFGTERSLLRR